MKWKIKPAEPEKTEKAFLFFPRYCGKCGTAYWLERVKRKGGSFFCECGNNLWCTKEWAEEELRDNKD